MTKSSAYSEVMPAGPLSRTDAIARLLATSLCVGEIRFAPGTFGTIPGLFIYVLASMLGMSAWLYLALVAALYFVGVWAAGRAERIFGKKDDGRIVIDEVVGALITMFYLPLSFWLVVAGFFAFRFFDVLKPGFRIVQRIRGGTGVMIDDVIAGVMANISLWILLLLIAALK